MSYSRNALKGVILVTTIGDTKGDTRSLDYGTYGRFPNGCMHF